MSGMPPPIAAPSFSGGSATIASVVRMFLAIEAAFCSAERVTIVGSMTPALTRSPYSPVSAFEALAGLQAADLLDHDRALEPGVLGDLADRLLERAADDLRARRLVGVEALGVDRALGVQQRDAAARDDALLERRPSRLQGVLDAVLLLLHLGLGRGADLDHGDPARELRQALLELLAVEVGVGVLDLGADLVDPALDLPTSRRRRR